MIKVEDIKEKFPRKNKRFFKEIQNLFHIQFPEDIDIRNYNLRYLDDKIVIYDKLRDATYIIRGEEDIFRVIHYYSGYILHYVYNQKTHALMQSNAAIPTSNGENIFLTEDSEGNDKELILYKNKELLWDVQSAPYSKFKISNNTFNKYIERINGDLRIKTIYAYTDDNMYYYGCRRKEEIQGNATYRYVDEEAISVKAHITPIDIDPEILLNALSNDTDCGFSISNVCEIQDENGFISLIRTLDVTKQGDVIICMLRIGQEYFQSQILSPGLFNIISYDDLAAVELFLRELLNGEELDKMLESMNKLKTVLFDSKFKDTSPDFISHILNNHNDFLQSAFYIYENKDKISNAMDVLGDVKGIKLEKKPNQSKA